VGQGQLLLAPMLTTAANVVASGGIVIPAGMVAVSVQVCLSQAVAGYVTPGSNVALFDTYLSGKGSQNVQQTCDASHQTLAPGGVNTQIVLPRVQVLSVGQSPASAQGTSSGFGSAQATGSAGSQSGAVLVTLAVSQTNAERLIQADEVGLPYLALLSGSSKTAIDAKPMQLFR
jgi:pilus assembly protein CpaB